MLNTSGWQTLKKKKKTLRLTNFKARDYKPLMLVATCITSCEADVRERPVCEWVRQMGYAEGGGVLVEINWVEYIMR